MRSPGWMQEVSIQWIHLYHWGDATDVRGDAGRKRLGTPGLGYINLQNDPISNLYQSISIKESRPHKTLEKLL